MFTSYCGLWFVVFGGWNELVCVILSDCVNITCKLRALIPISREPPKQLNLLDLGCCRAAEMLQERKNLAEKGKAVSQ